MSRNLPLYDNVTRLSVAEDILSVILSLFSSPPFNDKAEEREPGNEVEYSRVP